MNPTCSVQSSDRAFTETDRRIAEQVSSFVANFVKTGDSDGPSLARWDPVGASPVVMAVGDQMGPVPVAWTPARFAFFETFLTEAGAAAARRH